MTYTTPCRIISKYGLAIVNVSSHAEGALVNDGSLAIQHQHATRYFEVRTGLAYWGASSAWIELTSTSAITDKRHSFCHWAALANENSGHVVYSCSYEKASAETYITSVLPTGHPLIQFSDKTATSLAQGARKARSFRIISHRSSYNEVPLTPRSRKSATLMILPLIF